MVLILVGSSIPAESIPDIKIFSWDKLLHFAEYAILGALVIQNFSETPLSRTTWIILIIIGVGFPIFDEHWQSLIPGRIPAWSDGIVDGMGFFTGSYLSRRFIHLNFQSRSAFPAKEK